jgi:hypothetical protein
VDLADAAAILLFDSFHERWLQLLQATTYVALVLLPMASGYILYSPEAEWPTSQAR